MSAKAARRNPPTDERLEAAHRAGPVIAYLHDLVAATLVMLTVLVVRYHFEPKALPVGMVERATAAFAVLCALVFPLSRLERGYWRFTAISDLARIVRAVLLANLLLIPVLFMLDRLEDFPRTGLLIEAPILIVVLASSRLFIRALHKGDLVAAFRLEDKQAPLAVLVGRLEASADYLAALRRPGADRYRIAGLVNAGAASPALARHGRTIDGAEVLGLLDRLPQVLADARAAEGDKVRVVLTDPRPDQAVLRFAVEAAAEAGARVVRRRGPGTQLSPIEAADLLDRPPRRLDLDRARALITGKRILVTGAGGTIGGELTRQALGLDPAAMALVDASEFNLYSIDQELSASGHPRIWRPELGDVRDRTRMQTLFSDFRPDVVLHAAALKHVPLMEAHPAEAVLTNIMGAWIIASLAREGAASMVFISTDKAVNPTNVMGATKRVAERVVRSLCAEGTARASIVRFGNVLGSAGSVVPLFERQIADGGPVTVTHPDMERYFMTVQEAASLVLQAAALPLDGGDKGGVYVLAMGNPVRIEDLARQLIRLHGLRPDKDIALSHSGLRPGEKLFEEIFYAAEEVRPTAADGVLAAFDAAPDWASLRAGVKPLVDAASARDEAETLKLLKALEPAFITSTE